MLDFENMSDGTERQYRYWWKRWSEWCLERGLTEKPARPRDVVDFLGYLTVKGFVVSTVRLAVSVIAKAHEDMEESPTKSIEVRQAILLLTRSTSAKRRPGWAQKIEEDIVERLGGQIAFLRNALAREVRRALADIALAYLVFEDGFRFTELSRLVWDDLDIEGASAAIALPSGDKLVLPLSGGSVGALDDLMPADASPSSPVFLSIYTRRNGKEGQYAMTAIHLSRRVTRVAVESGFEPTRTRTGI